MAGQSTLDFIAHRNLTGRYAKGAPLSHKTYNFVDDIDAQVQGLFDKQKEDAVGEYQRYQESMVQLSRDAAEYQAAIKGSRNASVASAAKETLQDALVANAEKAKLPSFTKVRAALKVKTRDTQAATSTSDDVAATVAAAAKKAAESIRAQGSWTAPRSRETAVAKRSGTSKQKIKLQDGQAKQPLARRQRLEPVIEMPTWPLGESSAASRQPRDRGFSEDERMADLSVHHRERDSREDEPLTRDRIDRIESAEAGYRRQARYDAEDYKAGINRDSRQDSYASRYDRDRSDSREPRRRARSENDRTYHDRGRDDEPRGHAQNDDPEAHLNWNKIAEMVRTTQDDKTNGMFGKKLKMSKIKGKKKAGAKGKAASKKKKAEKEKSSSSSSSSSDSSSSSETKSSSDKKQKKKDKKEKKNKESEVNRVFSAVVIDQDSDLEVVSGSDLEVVSCATVMQPPAKKNKKDKKEKKDKKDKKDKKEKKDKKAKKDKTATLVKPVETKVAPIASLPPSRIATPKAPPQPTFKPVEERPEI